VTRPARVVVDLEAARANLDRVRQAAPGRRVMAIIKADAYGHGLVPMAQALRSAEAFGVACLEEAVVLRDAGIRHPRPPHFTPAHGVANPCPQTP
jgi:alanine racemase